MKIQRVVELALVLALVLSAAGCSDSKDGSGSGKLAQVRVACTFFPLADVSVDGKTVLDDIASPYVSDYLPLSAGKHTLHVVSAGGESDNAASVDLALDSGHSYLVVSYGNTIQNTDHALKVIDETDSLAQVGKDRSMIAFLHLVLGAPGLDGYIQDQRVMENLTYGQVSTYAAPVGRFDTKITLTGTDLAAYEDSSALFPPDTYSVVIVVGTILNPSLYISVRSPLNLLDFFTQLAASGEYYDTFQEMLQKSGLAEELAGPGPFTVFAPWDSAFGFSSNAILADPEKLKDVVGYYIVPENLPPYILYHRTELTTLQGSPLAVTLTTVNSYPHFLLNNVSLVHQDYRLSNGVLYEIEETLLPPSAQ